MNAIHVYNNFSCYTLSISSTPSKSFTPTRPRISKSFLLHETQLFGKCICSSSYFIFNIKLNRKFAQIPYLQFSKYFCLYLII